MDEDQVMVDSSHSDITLIIEQILIDNSVEQDNFVKEVLTILKNPTEIRFCVNGETPKMENP